jgi:tetratricopeptide (TPR) repeat protein
MRAVAAAFAQAFALHQQGALPEAERLYRRVLDREPGHFAALYRLGLVRAQRGALGDAAELIRSALRRTPASAEAHNDLGAVLKLLDRDAVGRADAYRPWLGPLLESLA